jgi:uncharacterized damage-inducible protein DinB
MIAFFNEFFEYNRWCNDRYMVALLRINKEHQSHRLFSHILNSHEMWLGRIRNEDDLPHPWDIINYHDYELKDIKNHGKTYDILNQFAMETLVEYRNTKGIKFTNSVRDILLHVVNHSSYHRAQIASELVGLSVKPPVTDYIAYKRS